MVKQIDDLEIKNHVKAIKPKNFDRMKVQARREV